MKIISFLILFFFSMDTLSAQQLYSFNVNGKYGYKNAEGKIIVKPVYQYASDIIASLGGVSLNGNWAVMNNSGEIITGFDYNGGVGDAKGFDLVPVYKESGFLGVNRYYGIVNKLGKEVAAPHYLFVEILSNNLAVVNSEGNYGIINSLNQPVLPLQYSKETLKVFTDIQPNGVYYENGQWKAFSFDGNNIKKWKYDDIVIRGEHAWAVKYNNKWGFVDSLGHEFVGIIYDSVGYFARGITWVSIAGKKGIINKQGTLVLPPKYDKIYTEETGNYFVIVNGKWGLADKQGREFVPMKYERINDFSEDLAAVQWDGKWGFINQMGKEVIAPAYDAVLPFSEGLTAVLQNKKVGFINKAGSMVIQPQFEDVVLSFYKGEAVVKLDGKEIFIDTMGKEIK